MGNLKTPFARHPWLVMLVALPDELSKRCAAALLPVPTLRVADVNAALERLAAVKPLVVVVHHAASVDVARLRIAGGPLGVAVFEASANETLEADLRRAVDESESARALSSSG